jgi:hypothetical protein
MNSSEILIGPIDYLIVEWPKGSPPTGEAFPYLISLVDQGVIKILDLSFVEKSEDGKLFAVEIADFDLDGFPDIAMFEGASSGLLDEGDIDEAGSAMEPGTAGAILVYENVWAAPFAAALRNSGAQLVASGRIPINAIIQTLDGLEASDA